MRFLWSRPARNISATRSYAQPRVEELESRFAPAGIRLDLVALHEFGHSLGLDHDANANQVSILDPYYNDSYDINNYFLTGADPAVVRMQAKFANLSISPWKDSTSLIKDPIPGDGIVQITYSFMKDGDRMDGNSRNVNTLFKTMDNRFGAGSWQGIFIQALNLWAQVSNGKIEFVPYNGAAGNGIETGSYSFNASGKAQNDSRFGDIRIGAHRMDGINKVIAHAYYPSTATAGGDAHFDNAEQWTLASSSSTAPAATTASGTSSKTKNTLTAKHEHGDDLEEEMLARPETPPDILVMAIAEAARSASFTPGPGYILNQVPVPGVAPTTNQFSANYSLPGAQAIGLVSGPRMVPGWAGSNLTDSKNDISPQENEGLRISIPAPVAAPVTPPVAEESQSQAVVKPMFLADFGPAVIEKTSPASSTSATKPGDEQGSPCQLPAAAVAALALGCYWWSPYTSMIEERRQRIQSIRW